MYLVIDQQYDFLFYPWFIFVLKSKVPLSVKVKTPSWLNACQNGVYSNCVIITDTDVDTSCTCVIIIAVNVVSDNDADKSLYVTIAFSPEYLLLVYSLTLPMLTVTKYF